VHNFAIGKLLEQSGPGRAVGNFAAGEHEGERSALGVGQRVDFRRARAARTADRSILGSVLV
jgi:hypothetical protein